MWSWPVTYLKYSRQYKSHFDIQLFSTFYNETFLDLLMQPDNPDLGRQIFTMGKFDWGVRYVIIFLYAQFWIRLVTVSYRGKKVRTVDSPTVRSEK